MGPPSAARKRKPAFLWQALLIILPVAALSVFGIFSLRQDRILAQHEAADRAQAIADDLLSRLWSAATVAFTNDQHAFRIATSGDLVFPPVCAPAPLPQPFNLADLSPSQAQIWQAIQTQTNSSPEPYRQFLASNPPTRFAAATHYALGLILTKNNQSQAAAAEFTQVATKYPHATGESGLPLQPLAQVKLLELPSAATNDAGFVALDSFCSNAVYQPSPLTPYLLTLASKTQLANHQTNTASHWLQVWQNHEFRRVLYSAMRPRLPDLTVTNLDVLPRIFWFNAQVSWQQSVTNLSDAPANGSSVPILLETSGSDWFAARIPGPPGEFWFACQPQPDISSALSAQLQAAPRIPSYFGLDVQLAGRTLPGLPRDLRLWREVPASVKSGSVKKDVSADVATTILASAAKTESGSDLMKVNIYLTSPATLYKLQTARTFWFGSLILFSAVGALIGLVAAWRAFNRQLQLSEMKSNFVASVSHELRAPIASVRLMAESLERGKVSEPAKQNEYFRFIGQESRRLSALIENVLDFSRIEQGRKQYDFEPTNLRSLLETTAKLMQPNAQERQIGLNLDLSNLQLANSDANGAPAESQPTLDGRAIQQALINLLDNAIKHSRPGQTVTLGIEPAFSAENSTSPSLHYSTTPPAEGSATPPIHFFVEDNGEGIPASEHEKIFERFYRLGSELRRETQGIGIGLSIVKHIVEAHHGRILVRSSPGHGSRFTIELPLSPNHDK
jgi:signal transduction histidine kinase